MCLICTQVDNGELSPWEVKENLSEISINFTTEHLKTLEKKIFEKIFQEVSLKYDDDGNYIGNFCKICQYIVCCCE